MDYQTKLEIEAAAFRSLKNHLMEKRTDVQNIDLMNLAGFCRNCLARWYQEAANERWRGRWRAEQGGQGGQGAALERRRVARRVPRGAARSANL